MSKKLQLYPCTALSVLWILEEYNLQQLPPSVSPAIRSLPSYDDICSSSDSWKNKTVSIVNRSEIMGRPLAAMLARKGATVYSIDIDSILQFRPNGRLRRCSPADTTIETCLATSDIVVTGVPDPDYELSLDHIQDNATIVNVSAFPNVCERTLLQTRPDVKYIPQVGKVTVAVLENNLMHLKEMHDHKE
jgi:methylenetetrahydrofolate dehydrogenase (NAD+)